MAMDYKAKGFESEDIARELNLGIETVDWLLAHGADTRPPADVKIGWRSIGVYAHRTEMIAMIMADILAEEEEKGSFRADTVLGIALNGIPLASTIASEGERELVIYKPGKQGKPGGLSANFAGIKGKRIVIIDDVLGSGVTVTGTIKTLREHGAEPVLVIVLANKTENNVIDGVPLRALIRARVIV